MKQLGCFRGFVALQMTDQVPRCGQIVSAHALDFPFLHAVFAEVPYARLKSFLDGDGWMGFRDANEGNVFGAATDPGGGSGNSFLNLKQVLSNRSGRHGLPFAVYSLPLAARGRKAANACR